MKLLPPDLVYDGICELRAEANAWSLWRTVRFIYANGQTKLAAPCYFLQNERPDRILITPPP